MSTSTLSRTVKQATVQNIVWQLTPLVAALLVALTLTACDLPLLSAPTATPTASDTAPPTLTAPASATATANALPPTASATASPEPSPTPSATHTATPTATPTLFAVVSSARRANIRRGPGVNFPVSVLLSPGSGVQVIGQNDDGAWHQVRLENGAEGWISAALLELQGSPSVVDEPADDTTVLSSETRIVVELAGAADAATPADDILVIQVPIVDLDVLHATATAIVGATATAAVSATDSETGPAEPTDAPATVTPTPSGPSATPRFEVRVFAFCDDPAFGIAAPRDLSAGSTIKIFWAWFASTDAYLRQHITQATHELRVNGVELRNVNAYRGNPSRSGPDQVVYWYVPYGPLEAGEYRVTYRVTWQNAISDGYASYGPGTAIEFEEESCSFAVR